MVSRTISTHVLLSSSLKSLTYQSKSSSPRLSVRSSPGLSILSRMKMTGNSNLKNLSKILIQFYQDEFENRESVLLVFQ